MLLRTWQGRTRLEDADAYERFLCVRAAPDYASTPGLIRTLFSRRDDGEVAYFLLVTLWSDIDAVKAFAGQDPSRAKYYPEDDDFLLETDQQSMNHRVFLDETWELL